MLLTRTRNHLNGAIVLPYALGRFRAGTHVQQRSVMPGIRIRHSLIPLALAVVILASCGTGTSQQPSSSTSSSQMTAVWPLHTAGAQIVDASGNVVHLSGVNWFGFETTTFAPQGLDVRNWQSMLDQIVQSGFNTIRLPYSNQLFEPSSVPTAINYKLNPDLKGLKGLALMDKIIAGAGARGLKVILDQHRPDAYAQSDLWYSNDLPASRWMSDWVMLAQHYRGNDAVIGADLHNEPHGQATWGDGNAATDWRLAAEQAGNAVLAANPDWLIIVEGIESYHYDYYWWGGNLEGAKQYPVQLSQPDKLVYSAHDYGPGVWPQQWFKAPNFPNNLPGVWNTHWGYLQNEGIAPVLLGEFGGQSMGTDKEGQWQRSLLTYLKGHSISYAYWAWNPDSSDTGGILEPNWKTVDQAKLRIISAFQWPLLGKQTKNKP
jgi:endoglucanase